MIYKVGDLIYLDSSLLVDKTQAGPHIIFAVNENSLFYLILWEFQTNMGPTFTFRWIRSPIIDHIKSRQLQ